MSQLVLTPDVFYSSSQLSLYLRRRFLYPSERSISCHTGHLDGSSLHISSQPLKTSVIHSQICP